MSATSKILIVLLAVLVVGVALVALVRRVRRSRVAPAVVTLTVDFSGFPRPMVDRGSSLPPVPLVGPLTRQFDTTWAFTPDGALRPTPFDGGIHPQALAAVRAAAARAARGRGPWPSLRPSPFEGLTDEQAQVATLIAMTSAWTTRRAVQFVLAAERAGFEPYRLEQLVRTHGLYAADLTVSLHVAAANFHRMPSAWKSAADSATRAFRRFADALTPTAETKAETKAEAERRRRRRERRAHRDQQRAAHDPRQTALWTAYHHKTRHRNRRRNR